MMSEQPGAEPLRMPHWTMVVLLVILLPGGMVTAVIGLCLLSRGDSPLTATIGLVAGFIGCAILGAIEEDRDA
jgi:hypothetical protein